ncbi:uncharacterized protein Z518_08426 [Rhinocladiella mackenziei CBS 650.93]|uniref:Major facilitator superfamily (MFS) profile domain-containing protein n=1 Tax=Rhinocladiella mackenziei CBS 650.93 TaxID=1442369 RepID=A0A0D2J0T3_9EURO|nr:uncharacterized protein Z518_08426 [Rhinocladiella mackenziei CBS 650.93]KIX02485.1 hypothetical protein Z518_08426 [Rhinocladiella mackenziei CBS 650.93]
MVSQGMLLENTPTARSESPVTSQMHDSSDAGMKGEDDSFEHTENTATYHEFANIDEKKVLRKMDLRLIPTLALLYLLSFLDRANIGNAKIEGLEASLGMTSPQFNWTLTIFFFAYAAFEVPSNLLLKRLRPSVWLPSIMVAWGTVMTLMGTVQGYHGLLTARFFLGVTEAGLYPGLAYYITMWYTRHEAQFRQALFFSAASMAGAFSGLLAFAIAKMEGVGNYEGWRWIFILEGLATVVAAIAAYFILYDFPETASFLTEEERAWVIHRLKYPISEGTVHMVAQSEEFRWKYVKDAFSDWQIYLGVVMFWGIVCPLYGTALFLPTIINDLGYKSATAQLLTIPIYITAAAIGIGAAYSSDRYGQRSPYLLFFQFFICIGFIITMVASAKGGVPGVVYAGVFIAICGIYTAAPGNITWISNNLAGSYKRSAGMAIQIGLGNLSGAMASNFYRGRDKPKYILGHALELGFVVAGVIAVLALRLNYQRINRKRDRCGVPDQLTAEDLSQMGDRAPTWRYML